MNQALPEGVAVSTPVHDEGHQEISDDSLSNKVMVSVRRAWNTIDS